MHNTLICITKIKKSNTKFFTIIPQRINLLLRNWIRNWQSTISCWHIMVRCCKSRLRPSDTTTCQPQPFKCLRTGYLMNEVTVNIKQRILTSRRTDNVIVPDFVKKCFRTWHTSTTIEEQNETFNVAGSEACRY